MDLLSVQMYLASPQNPKKASLKCEINKHHNEQVSNLAYSFADKHTEVNSCGIISSRMSDNAEGFKTSGTSSSEFARAKV